MQEEAPGSMVRGTEGSLRPTGTSSDVAVHTGVPQQTYSQQPFFGLLCYNLRVSGCTPGLGKYGGSVFFKSHRRASLGLYWGTCIRGTPLGLRPRTLRQKPSSRWLLGPHSCRSSKEM